MGTLCYRDRRNKDQPVVLTTTTVEDTVTFDLFLDLLWVVGRHIFDEVLVGFTHDSLFTGGQLEEFGEVVLTSDWVTDVVFSQLPVQHWDSSGLVVVVVVVETTQLWV
ncbi:hypothetical protein WICPIJ_009206 [Wickerhamomyces pijperi]|uniref:Uncharacterized protein n=1 Tax=Wickerhamomyces pijperi TaxID=599730 RepID=A0A9P8TEH9_WICPI|nr:hypothetical protein WICPIJ_009206 [Wickerhamomyces pijperi]